MNPRAVASAGRKCPNPVADAPWAATGGRNASGRRRVTRPLPEAPKGPGRQRRWGASPPTARTKPRRPAPHERGNSPVRMRSFPPTCTPASEIAPEQRPPPFRPPYPGTNRDIGVLRECLRRTQARAWQSPHREFLVPQAALTRSPRVRAPRGTSIARRFVTECIRCSPGRLPTPRTP